jgi:hypothetical protein
MLSKQATTNNEPILATEKCDSGAISKLNLQYLKQNSPARGTEEFCIIHLTAQPG